MANNNLCVFLEVGTHNFNKINSLLENKDIDRKWKIYLFEPNPISIPFIEEGIKKHYRDYNIELLPIGVLDKEEERDFFLGSKSQGSATLFRGKGHVDYNKVVRVKCIDLDSWIKNNLDKDNYIYMNMDIEGAEYIVLPKMIYGGSIYYLNKIEIEFHSNKFAGRGDSKNFGSIHSILKEFFNTFDCEKKLYRL